MHIGALAGLFVQFLPIPPIVDGQNHIADPRALGRWDKATMSDMFTYSST